MAGLLVKLTKDMINSNKSDVTTCLRFLISRWTWEIYKIRNIAPITFKSKQCAAALLHFATKGLFQNDSCR